MKVTRLDPVRFRDLRVPTLLLAGGASAAAFQAAARAVAAALSHSRLVVLPRQGNAAMDTAIDLFTTEMNRFATELPGASGVTGPPAGRRPLSDSGITRRKAADVYGSRP